MITALLTGGRMFVLGEDGVKSIRTDGWCLNIKYDDGRQEQICGVPFSIITDPNRTAKPKEEPMPEPEEEEEPEQVPEKRIDNDYVCGNCGNPGHMKTECPDRTIKPYVPMMSVHMQKWQYHKVKRYEQIGSLPHKIAEELGLDVGEVNRALLSTSWEQYCT